jgi:hypothetical protein
MSLVDLLPPANPIKTAPLRHVGGNVRAGVDGSGMKTLQAR